MTEDTLNDVLIDRLKTFAAKPNDNVEAIRSVAARLHSRTASQDKGIKERTLERIWRKDSGSLGLLLNLLEVMRDHVTACSLAGILHECVSPKLGKRHSPAVKQLVAMNATQVLVKLIQQQQMKDVALAESLLQELLWILAQVAQKDTRFSIKVRLLGATKMFHHLLKTHYDSTRMVFPLLLVIKALAKNLSTVSVLAKDGICSTMDKTILTIGLSPSPRLRLALNVLKTLSKHKLCCGRMVKGSMVPLLLRVFERWERYDGMMKLRICSFTLTTLQHVCLTKAGRKAVRKNSGLLLLHKFCSVCPDDKVYDPLLTRVCAILNLCAEKHDLPVTNLLGPASFALPPGIELINTGQRSSSSSRETSPESEEDSSDEGPADDVDGTEEASKERRGSNLSLRSAPSQRDMDDLMQYSRHIAELMPSSKQLEDWSGSDDDDELPYPGFVLSLLNGNDGIVRQARPLPQRHKLCYDWCGLGILGDIDKRTSSHTAYCMISSRIKSVLPFVKVAYPDMVGGDGCSALEPLNIKDRTVCRSKLLKSLEGSSFNSRVVYDLDSLSSDENITFRELTNDDELRAGHWVSAVEHLLFESRFESGNLRKAIQVNDHDYNLILMPDVNSTRHHQWFYFSVSNMEAGVPYTLNIINCEKQNSQFNYGMKPIMYSVRDAVLGQPGWVRAGTDICYFRNSYQNFANKGLCYYTATFTIKFQHAYDICYLAYHYPYTYSQLLTQLWRWGLFISPVLVYFRVSSLCSTLNGNETPVVTITAPESKANPIKKRELVFLTGRVHPGESNSSWVMLGTLRYLLSREAENLRSTFVFKIVPMLNIDGVINGCHRCGLTDEDLNRRWSQPNKTLHPVIYHTKGLLELCTRVMRKPPYLFCDYHGHSRRKNVFLYGCSAVDSWNEADKLKPDNPVEYLMLPHLMQHFAPTFALSLCNYKVERNRETTARVTVWREYGVSRSYTMESTFCGCDQGQYQGYHLSTVHLLEVGANFCQALACLQNETSWRMGALGHSLNYLRIAGVEDDRDACVESPLASESSDDDVFQN